MVDLQYFDGKISIFGWILLTGARNILSENFLKQNKFNEVTESNK